MTEGLCALLPPWTPAVARELLAAAAPRKTFGAGLAMVVRGVAVRRAVCLGAVPPIQWAGVGPLLGHARQLTTYTNRAEALQPLAFRTLEGEPFAVAHVGEVPNAVAWCRAERLTWLSPNDSEVIGRSLERDPAPWPARLWTVAAKLQAPFALAVATPTTVWLLRRGAPLCAPLFVTRRRVCSRTFRGARPLPDNELWCAEGPLGWQRADRRTRERPAPRGADRRPS